MEFALFFHSQKFIYVIYLCFSSNSMMEEIRKCNKISSFLHAENEIILISE